MKKHIKKVVLDLSLYKYIAHMYKPRIPKTTTSDLVLEKKISPTTINTIAVNMDDL